MSDYQIVPGLTALADLVTRMERRITELEIKMELRTKPTSAEINKAQEDFIKRTSPDPKPDDRLDLVTPTRRPKPRFDFSF